MKGGDRVRFLARHVAQMTWTGGTVTTIETVGALVEVHDEGERMLGGEASCVRTIDETLNLADEHDECARLLRAAAKKAQKLQTEARTIRGE